MSEQKKDMIVMSKEKFAMLIAGTIGGTIFTYGFVSQVIERIF